jgi:hypothetical protein
MSAGLIGAMPVEVVVMNSLTVNLHLMMVSFYRPERSRHKVLIESPAFPSDRRRASQAGYHGLIRGRRFSRRPSGGRIHAAHQDLLDRARRRRIRWCCSRIIDRTGFRGEGNNPGRARQRLPGGTEPRARGR